MANLTLSIPSDLKMQMDHFPEINWSEVARQAIMEKTRVLGQMQRLLSQSKLTEQDTITIGRTIKQRMWKKSQRST